MSFLIMEDENKKEKIFILHDTSVIGRNAGVAVQILGAGVSREHATITKDGEEFKIKDLGSRNGTYVNGSKIEETVLKDGDLILIGNVNLNFCKTIGGYKLIEDIGSGRLGTVYKAEQLSMGRLVAVKILHKERAADKRLVDNFLEEARGIGRIHHPGILQVHDAGKDKDLYYFSMEFVEGQSLKELLDRDSRLSVETSIEMIKAMAQTIDILKSNDLVHGRICPKNIMLTKELFPKLTDISIKKPSLRLGEDNKEVKIKRDDTPVYMAPELFLGGDADNRADIYSLGATFYRMLAGQPANMSDNLEDVKNSHLSGARIPLKELNPDVPRSLEEIINKMMNIDRNARYPGGQQVIDALSKISALNIAASKRIVTAQRTPVSARTPQEKISSMKSRKRKSSLISWLVFAVILIILLFIGRKFGYSLHEKGSLGFLDNFFKSIR